MLDFVRRMRPRHLYAAWVGWWLVLLLRLTPAFVAIWNATRGGSGQGNVSLGFSNGDFNLVVTLGAQTLWSGSISFMAFAMLVGLPPLALWALWISVRPARAAEREPVR